MATRLQRAAPSSDRYPKLELMFLFCGQLVSRRAMKLERQRTVLKFREPVALLHISPLGRNFQVGALGNAPIAR